MTTQIRSAEQAEHDVVVFKALANSIRLRIVSLVAGAPEGQVSAGQIVEAFDLSQPTISHHLRLLREAGVLTTFKTSTYVFYRFAPTLIETVSAVLPDAAVAAPPAQTILQRRTRVVAPDGELPDAAHGGSGKGAKSSKRAKGKSKAKKKSTDSGKSKPAGKSKVSPSDKKKSKKSKKK